MKRPAKDILDGADGMLCLIGAYEMSLPEVCEYMSVRKRDLREYRERARFAEAEIYLLERRIHQMGDGLLEDSE